MDQRIAEQLVSNAGISLFLVVSRNTPFPT